MKRKIEKKILERIDHIIAIGEIEVPDQDELIDLRRNVKKLLKRDRKRGKKQ